MNTPVLEYVSKGSGQRAVRRAGIVLILWAAFLLPVGILIAFLTGKAGLDVTDRGISELWQSLSGLLLFLLLFLLFTLAVAFVFWGVSAMRCGVALIQGASRPLQIALTLTQVCEILAYLGLAVFILCCLAVELSADPAEPIYLLISLLAYLLLPAALTVTRMMLRNADEAIASSEYHDALRNR